MPRWVPRWRLSFPTEFLPGSVPMRRTARVPAYPDTCLAVNVGARVPTHSQSHPPTHRLEDGRNRALATAAPSSTLWHPQRHPWLSVSPCVCLSDRERRQLRWSAFFAPSRSLSLSPRPLPPRTATLCVPGSLLQAPRCHASLCVYPARACLCASLPGSRLDCRALRHAHAATHAHGHSQALR